MPVNPRAPEPEPPGEWVDAERCTCCGERYADFRAGVTFAAGCRALRLAAFADGDQGGGYRSRRAVLWRMRILKLERWYEAHFECDRPDPLDALGIVGDDGLLYVDGVALF